MLTSSRNAESGSSASKELSIAHRAVCCPKANKEGHQWIALLSSFALLDVLHCHIITFPELKRWLAGEHSDKRHDGWTTFHSHQRIKH